MAEPVERLRFHLDENVDHAVAQGLRLRGIDATTTSDAQLLNLDDGEQVAFALREGRVLVTHDAPLLQRHLQGDLHAGIVYGVPRGEPTIGLMVRFLHRLWQTHAPHEVAGQVFFMPRRDPDSA